MKRSFLGLVVLVVSTFLVVGSASASTLTTFTMDATQLQSLYETFGSPESALWNVQSIPGGAKYAGNVKDSSPGRASIGIGANFWGKPEGGNVGDESSNVTLGMGSFTGYDSYGLQIKNLDENPWEYQVYFNVGWTDSGETNYYVEGTWTEIAAFGSSAAVILDFSSAHVYGGIYSGDLVDVTGLGVNWDHITNIGFQIAGDVPLGGPNGHDYTYETEVTSIPEPATLFLLGIGMLGMISLKKEEEV